MRKILAFGALACLLVAPLSAGFHYRAVTVQEGQEGSAGDFTVEGWIDGPRAKIVFVESGNPFMPPDSYLVTTDGGRTVYLVNPQERTFAKWDLGAILGAVGGMMEAAGGMVKMEVSDPKVEKLLEEDGGSIVGYPTTHYRYRTSYTLAMKVMGMKRGDSYVVDENAWYTTALADEGFGVWLAPRETGFEMIDKLMEAERQKVQGFPLRSVITTTTTGTKKTDRVSTTVVKSDVTMLEKTSTPDSFFEIDPTYTEVPMAPIPGAVPGQQPDEAEPEESEDEEEEEGGMFKKLRKRIGG